MVLGWFILVEEVIMMFDSDGFGMAWLMNGDGSIIVMVVKWYGSW